MNLGGNTGKPRPIWTGFFMSKNKEGFMKIKKILPMLTSLLVLTACSTSKVEQNTRPIKAEAISHYNKEIEFQEEEIIDFSDPNFDIENIEYDSCCK